MVAFKTNPVALEELLVDVGKGKIQLPDFQRDWLWDDDRIRSLIASISRGFPVGVVMTLQAGGEVDFKRRLVKGVSGADASETDQFLLDGQQRLTSLYQALKSPNPTYIRGSKVGRWYYVDMIKAMADDVDREEAIVSVPEDRRITRNFGREVLLDVSTPELEYANHMMPAGRLLDAMDWLFDYDDYWEGKNHPSGTARSSGTASGSPWSKFSRDTPFLSSASTRRLPRKRSAPSSRKSTPEALRSPCSNW